MLWSSGWTRLERPSSFTSSCSEFTQNVSTKGLNAELRAPVAGYLGITFQVCDIRVKRSSDPCVTPTPTGQTVSEISEKIECLEEAEVKLLWISRASREARPVWVLASKRDLVDKELSVQELCSLVDRAADGWNIS